MAPAVIRVVVLRPGTGPEITSVQVLDDIASLCATSELARDHIRLMPEGYELIALSSRSAHTRPNVELPDRTLFGTVVFAFYDSCRDAFVDPGRTASLAALAEARLLPRGTM